jgi:ATP phosphoribosyltransferase
VLEAPGGTRLPGVSFAFLLLKNSDVPTYVEHGIADLGICGTDVLDEVDADVLRLSTLPFGACRICLAGLENRVDELSGRPDGIRVATKYPRLAARYFESSAWDVELIPLSGSIELAAVLGLADLILDLVETGGTLAANRLVVVEEVGRTAVRLVANRALAARQALAVREVLGAVHAEEVP